MQTTSRNIILLANTNLDMTVKPKKEPTIFRLIDEYKNNPTVNLHNHIVKFPKDITLIFAGHCVYGRAALTSLACLQVVHESYLEIQDNINRKPYNIKGDNGYTPLHATIVSNLTKQASYLIDIVNVDVSIKDNDGNTPLHLACKCSRHAIIGNLLSSGGSASVNVLNSSSQTPLSISVGKNDVVASRMLLKRGATNIHKKGRFTVGRDVMSQVDLYGSDAMKGLFQTFVHQKFNKRNTKTNDMITKKIIRDAAYEFPLFCKNLEEGSDTTYVRNLAFKLDISTKDESKKEICAKILLRLGLLTTNPKIRTTLHFDKQISG
jgi:ankyrin repeat protein